MDQSRKCNDARKFIAHTKPEATNLAGMNIALKFLFHGKIGVIKNHKSMIHSGFSQVTLNG